MRTWVTEYWFGEALLAVFFGSIIVVAFIVSPTTEAVSLFGWEVPAVCTLRNFAGIGCPGCGLTRSFAFMAHGQFATAFEMNWLGPLLFVGFASQPPYRIYRIVRWWQTGAS